ncbi:MAG TPA: nucleotidyltransferase family protein [Planctomycetota bacterium]|nr:nucleotidyltransferase family protein [Planctomycetota bacterium]
MPFPIENYAEQLKQFCEKWKIAELALFGSALRDDFTPTSDVDMLVTRSESTPSLPWAGEYYEMERELEEIFGRKVDLVSKRGLLSSRNRLRKNEIMNSAKVIYGEA